MWITNEFHFCRNEEDQVPVNKRIVKRSKKAVETGIKLLRSKEHTPSTSDECDVGHCCPCLKQPEKPPSLQFAQHAGFKMMPGFFFPAMPKFLADVWVGLELLVTLFDFIFTCVTFESSPVNIFILILVIISFFLALIDGFLYFIQGGSCIACFRYCQKKLSKSENSSEDNVLEDDDKKVLCQFIPNKWKEHLSTWFELLRTVISELLLYPLAVADVIALVVEKPFNQTDTNSRIDFSLITIGTFYLVLSVYFMRSFMAISSLLNLRRVHKNTKSNYVALVTKFCIHLVGQILVNAVILVMIAMKVRNERCDENDARNTANETILIPSPFLWYDMIAGDLLPFLGVILFFVVNYPTVKEFSMAFYIDMMSTIIGESFSDLVFQGEGVKHAKEKAKEVQEKANLTQTKVDFEEYQKLFTLRTKVIYRLTHPAVVVSSLLYFCLMGAFIVCYILGRQNPCDSSSPIEIVLLNGDPGIDSMFFIGTFIIIIANYQAVIVVATWFIIIGVIAVIIAIIPVLAIVLTPALFIIAAIYFIVRDGIRQTRDND